MSEDASAIQCEIEGIARGDIDNKAGSEREVELRVRL